MKRILLMSLLSLLGSFCVADNFIGSYKCAGFDPYLNKNYSGTLHVEQQGYVYKITMLYDTGEKYKATGGPYTKELLSVVFQDLSDPYVVGLEQYQWSRDRKQIGGYWVYLGKDKLGKEVCTKL